METPKDKIFTEKSLARSLKLFFGRVRVPFRHDFFQSKVVRWLMALGILANIINWLILFIFIRPVSDSIILHYNVYFGVDMIGRWKLTLFMPAIGVALFAINFLLASYFYRKKERIAAHILLMAALMAQLSLIVASISVIIINY